MYQTIQNIDQFKQMLTLNKLVLVYYSNEACGVCKVLKPQVDQMCSDAFPNLHICEVNTLNSPEVSSQQSIFTIPTIVVYALGKETIRKSRHVSIEELRLSIGRLYEQVFA